MTELKYSVDILDILEVDNVADILNEEDLATIGGIVTSEYDDDLESRSEWEDRAESALDLALQVVEIKSTPWQGAANVKYPLLSTAAMQFAARAYPALIPGPNVVKGRTTGFDPEGLKAAKAVRIGKHMSYQIFEEMESWEEEMDRLCSTLPILGTVFKKTYHDSVLGKNKSILVLPQDLVVDYYAKNLEEAARKTHVIPLSENDIYERIAAGVYSDVDLSKDSDEGEDKEKQRTGLNSPSGEAPYTVLEQHRTLDLDGDGYGEPYVVTVHKDSNTVVRIVRRFDEGDITFNGENIVRIQAIEYFTKFGFLPSPDGSFYDVGFGTMLGPINETINSLTNQLLDAGTLSNMQAGFISKGIRLKGGATQFTPGEWKNVNTTGDDLRKGIFPLPIREPSTVLFQLLGTMINAGEKLSSVTDVMTGELPGQNTKATVAVQTLDQGMKVFNAIYKRTHRALKKEFRKLYALNAKYLPENDYFQIMDLGQSIAPIARSDYAEGDVSVIPYSDPNVATESQRMAKIEALNPLLQLGTIDPMEYTKRYLEVTEQPNPEALMAKPKGLSPEQQQEQAKLQLEQQKAQLEAQVKTATLAIESKLAESKISKEEIESIVALMQLGFNESAADTKVSDNKIEE